VPPAAGLKKYLEKAWLVPWNLLAFFGGLAAAGLSPWPDALIPLVWAGELAYLAGMVSIRRFRAAVDAEEYARARREGTAGQVPATAVSELLATLPNDARLRFHRLRLRCLDMQRIAAGARGRSPAAEDAGDELRRSSLDRLLWIFLRLLVSQDSLRRFLRSTTEAELASKATDLERQLAAAQPNDERLVASLTDSVALAALRLDNYRKADQNAHFMMVELDRIESKIQALTEMMVNRQDPDLLASQVDQAAQSMSATETAIRELQQITGLADQLTEPPPILDVELGKVAQ
jgi:hypothetical protein